MLGAMGNNNGIDDYSIGSYLASARTRAEQAHTRAEQARLDYGQYINDGSKNIISGILEQQKPRRRVEDEARQKEVAKFAAINEGLMAIGKSIANFGGVKTAPTQNKALISSMSRLNELDNLYRQEGYRYDNNVFAQSLRDASRTDRAKGYELEQAIRNDATASDRYSQMQLSMATQDALNARQDNALRAREQEQQDKRYDRLNNMAYKYSDLQLRRDALALRGQGDASATTGGNTKQDGRTHNNVIVKDNNGYKKTLVDADVSKMEAFGEKYGMQIDPHIIKGSPTYNKKLQEVYNYYSQNPKIAKEFDRSYNAPVKDVITPEINNAIREKYGQWAYLSDDKGNKRYNSRGVRLYALDNSLINILQDDKYSDADKEQILINVLSRPENKNIAAEWLDKNIK